MCVCVASCLIGITWWWSAESSDDEGRREKTEPITFKWVAEKLSNRRHLGVTAVHLVSFYIKLYNINIKPWSLLAVHYCYSSSIQPSLSLILSTLPSYKCMKWTQNLMTTKAFDAELKKTYGWCVCRALITVILCCRDSSVGKQSWDGDEKSDARRENMVW